MSSSTLAEREQIDFTVVGPELPLSLGLADRFASRGPAGLRPDRGGRAPRIEQGVREGVHGAPRRADGAIPNVVDSAAAATSTLCARAKFGFPVVLKADGLAAGKGVVIAADSTEAEAAVARGDGRRRFGAAGAALVIEECLTGPEVSFFVVSDGARARVRSARRRITSGSSTTIADRTPAAWARSRRARSSTTRCTTRVMREIVEPVIAGMAAEGHPFRGFLYVGLDADGRRTEGDRVQRAAGRSGGAGDPAADRRAAAAASRGRRGGHAATGDRAGSSAEALVGVVLASRGYPESSESGRADRRASTDAEAIPGVSVYHAGTAHARRPARDRRRPSADRRRPRRATSPRRSRARTPASRRSRSTGCSIVGDIGTKGAACERTEMRR